MEGRGNCCPFTTVVELLRGGGGGIVGFSEKSMPHYRKENVIIYSQQIYTKGTKHLTFLAALDHCICGGVGVGGIVAFSEQSIPQYIFLFCRRKVHFICIVSKYIQKGQKPFNFQERRAMSHAPERS